MGEVLALLVTFCVVRIGGGCGRALEKTFVENVGVGGGWVALSFLGASGAAASAFSCSSWKADPVACWSSNLASSGSAKPS